MKNLKMKTNAIKKKISATVFYLYVIFSFAQAINFFYGLEIKLSVFLVIFAISGFAYFVVSNRYEFEKHPTLNKYFALELSLFAFLFFAVGMQRIFLVDVFDNLNRSAFFTTFLYSALGLLYFYIGAALQGYKSVSVVAALWFAPLLFVILSIATNTDGNLLVSYSALTENRSDGIRPDHLMIGQAAGILLLVSIAYSPKRFKAIVYIASVMCLFTLGGRTVVGAFLAAIVLRFIIVRDYSSLLKFTALLLVTVLAIYFYLGVDLNDPAISRMIFHDGFSGDESKASRDVLFKDGLSHLFAQSLFGNPNIIVINNGSLGSYSHNLLSAWQFFGVFPFALLLMCIFAAGKFIYINSSKLNTPIDEFGLLLFLVAVISVFIGKSINYALFWVAIGFWLYRIREIKRSKLPVLKSSNFSTEQLN